MVFDLSQVTGIGPYETKTEKNRTLYLKDGKVFLVINPNTLEVRCDAGLSANLIENYESVMVSRYFGKGGIEIVPAGQLTDAELADLARLSYNLTISS